jgi:hypothetical protein
MAPQKMIHGSGFVACGLEPGLMPESAYAGEGVTGRASCLYAQRRGHKLVRPPVPARPVGTERAGASRLLAALPRGRAGRRPGSGPGPHRA